MSTLKRLNKSAREQKAEVLDKCFLIFRPDDLPQLLRPVKVRVPSTCSLSGKNIYAGDYAYPCHVNPVRLTPYGTARVLIPEALKRGDRVLPLGYYAQRIPTTEVLLAHKDIQEAEAAKGRAIEKQTRKFLSAGM